MRIPAPLSASLIALVVVGAARESPAEPLRLTVAVDSFAANQRDSMDLAWAEIGFSFKGDARSEHHRVHWDWVNRESLVNDFSRRELHELAYTASVGRAAVTAGRFRIPGGFWLFADGLQLAYRPGPFTTAVTVGYRAFTNGRAEANLRPDPLGLPLIAAHVALVRPTWNVTLSVAHTRDVLEIHRGFDPDDGGFDLDGVTEGTDLVSRTEHDEQFIDAQAAWFPRDDLYLGVGATVGTRYLAHFPVDASDVAVDLDIEEQPLGSASAYALADWRLTRRVRLTATSGAHRTKLLIPSDDADVLAPFDGSFLDEGLQLRWQPRPALSFGSRYRLRLRDGGNTHRGEIDARTGVREPIELFGSAAVDWHRWTGDEPVGFAPRRALITRAGVAAEGERYSAQLGVLYTEALGSEGLLSMPTFESPQAQLPPYTLDNRRAVFFRGFGAQDDGLFVGLDTEIGLELAQYRAFLQLGWIR